MTPLEYEAALKDAEVQLTRLKHLYDQWFQGFERLEPTILRKNFERSLHLMRKQKIRRAALRFRFQMLVQRYTTLQTYWRRVARQIEEGTYRRDVMKVRRKRQAQREALLGNKRRDPDTLQDLDLNFDDETGPYRELEDVSTSKRKRTASRPPQERVAGRQREYFDDPLPMPPKERSPVDDLFPDVGGAESPRHHQKRESPQRSTAERPSKIPPRPPKNNGGLGEARLRQLYDAYVREKKKNREAVENVDYEKVAKRIKKMVPKLQREHKGKQVDFEVVVKDGRVGLKPIVKK